jgi:phosphoglycerate dehydrogenase-like enzyme
MIIVGFGDIGAACGKLVKAFGTKVIGFKRRPEVTSDAQKSCADEIYGMERLEEFLGTADFVVGVLPKTPNTHHFFDANFFAKMNPSAVFMNIGRGPTVKEVDLISALEQKKIAGAVLDVFEVEPLS